MQAEVFVFWVSVVKDPDSLNIGCCKTSCMHIVFFWVLLQYSLVVDFWYFSGILCFQQQCAFASLPSVLAVHHVPWELRWLVPLRHLLHLWDLCLGFHDGHLKALKLCVLVQGPYFVWQLSLVTSCNLSTLHVCGWLSWLRFFVLFFSSVFLAKCQYSASN